MNPVPKLLRRICWSFLFGLLFLSAASAQTQWTQRIPNKSYGFGLVRYLNNQFITDQLTVSPDGVNWTALNSPAGPLELVFSGGNYVELAVSGSVNVVRTSTNLQTWTTRYTPPNSSSLEALTANGGTVVAVGTEGRIARSTDNGITWAPALSPVSFDLYSVTFGNGLFVASGVSYSNVITSPDGSNWTIRSIPVSNSTSHKIVYGNGVFVIVSGSMAITSADGVNWTGTDTAPVLNAIAFGGNVFIGAASAGKIYTSVDGKVWTLQTTGNLTDLNSVTFGNNTFVAVGYNETILSSPLSSGPAPVVVPNLVVRPAAAIQWQSQTGTTYRVQVSTNLVDWNNVGTPITGDNTLKTYYDPTDQAQKKYYRVVVP